MHPAASQTGLQQGADNECLYLNQILGVQNFPSLFSKYFESHGAPEGPLPAGNDPVVDKVAVQVARSPALRGCLAFVHIHSTASSWDPSEKHKVRHAVPQRSQPAGVGTIWGAGCSLCTTP